jgi:hypothetical protein
VGTGCAGDGLSPVAASVAGVDGLRLAVKKLMVPSGWATPSGSLRRALTSGDEQRRSARQMAMAKGNGDIFLRRRRWIRTPAGCAHMAAQVGEGQCRRSASCSGRLVVATVSTGVSARGCDGRKRLGGLG